MDETGDEDPSFHLDALQKALNEAVYDSSGWQRALELLTEATGCTVGHYLGWSGPSAPSVNLLVGMGDEAIASYAALGGGDPQRNPIVAMGLRIGVGVLYSSDDAWPLEARRDSPLWNKHFVPRGLAQINTIVLARDGLDHYVLNIVRAEGSGPLPESGRRLFQSAAERWLAALESSKAMGFHAAQLAAAALEQVSIGAVLFDGFRRVAGMTTEAERLLSRGGPLRVARRRLLASGAAANDQLNEALLASLGARGARRSATVRISGGPRDLLVRFSPLPASVALGVEPAAVATLEEIPAALTEAETAIARALGEGMRAGDIAAMRGVSIDTVRTQIKVIYRKTGASSQVELMTLLRSRAPSTP